MTFMSEPERAMEEMLSRGYPEFRKAMKGVYPSETARQIIEELVPQWAAHFLAGNKGYGDQADKLGPAAQFVDIHRKVGKLQRAVWEDKDIGKESVEEVTLDLIGHCFLLLRTLRPLQEEVRDAPPEF